MSIFDKPWETCGGFCQDPVTLTIASMAFQAFGAIQEGQAAKAEADYQSQVAEQNASIARQQTNAELEQQDKDRRLRRGANIAASGASGVGIESFGDILQMNAADEALDMMTIKSEGLLQENNFLNDASLAKARGKNAQTKGYIGAASSVLGGASSLYKPSSGGTINWNGGGSTKYSKVGKTFGSA